MKIIADKFADFSQHCRYRAKWLCVYKDVPKKPRCISSNCPLILLPLKGEKQDAVLKPNEEVV